MKGVAYYCLGKPDMADQLYDEVLKIKPDYHLSLYNKACYRARAQDFDAALSYLKRAIELNPRYKSWALRETAFIKLRDDPRFLELVKGS